MSEPFLEQPPVRRSRAGRWLVVVPILFSGLLLLVIPGTVAALRGQFVGGAPGTFVVEQVECTRLCAAVGTFEPDGGGPAVAADWDGPSYGLAVGQPVEAVLPAGSTTAFPPDGSATWLAQLLLCAALLGAIVVSISAVRRLRRPLPATPDDPTPP